MGEQTPGRWRQRNPLRETRLHVPTHDCGQHHPEFGSATPVIIRPNFPGRIARPQSTVKPTRVGWKVAIPYSHSCERPVREERTFVGLDVDAWLPERACVGAVRGRGLGARLAADPAEVLAGVEVAGSMRVGYEAGRGRGSSVPISERHMVTSWLFAAAPVGAALPARGPG